MYISTYAIQFWASNYNKSKFKEKKVADELATVVQDVINLCNELDNFNNDFATLNNNVGSDEWSQDAADISKITDDIKSTFNDYCKNITGHIGDINIAVGQANSKLAGKVAENDTKLQGISSNISNIKTNK